MRDNLLASLLFFTRLPWWRLRQVDVACFRHVTDYWPFVGWLTGGCVASVCWGTAHVFSSWVAVVLALVARMLLTGALHEDGLADFFDGLGGGTTRNRVLDIMKDSHIGTYGVLALVFYALLAVGLLSSLPVTVVPLLLFMADVWGKVCVSFLPDLLPYARNEEQSKAHTVYTVRRGRSLMIHLFRCLVAVSLPIGFALYIYGDAWPWWAFAVPPVVFACLTGYLHRRLQGYTGDCCGALFLLCELSYVLSFTLLYR